jgi:hypothetical protein
MAGRKCINVFLAPSSSNVRTGPKMTIRDGSFELKQALINRVQQSPFLGDLQHIHHPRSNSGCGTPSPLSIFIIRKARQWFYSTKRQCHPRRNAPMHFSPSFFIGQDQCPSEQRSLPFNNSRIIPLLRHGRACRIISLHAPITAWRSGSSSKDSIMG